VWQQLGRNALTGVGDRELGESAVLTQPHGDPAAAGRELHRVGKQVADHLLQTVGVGAQRARAWLEPARDLDALRGRRGPHGVDRQPRHARKLHRTGLHLELPGAHAPEIQQVVDQFQLRLRTLLDTRRDRRDLRILGAFQGENAVPSEDGIERRAQLVRDHREELILGAVLARHIV
jgi:hypothetical protein